MAHDQRFSRLASTPLGFVFLLLCLFPAQALGAEVTLAWDPPSTAHGGFILAYGTSSSNYTQTQDVGTQSIYTVTSLNPGTTYYFAVKAYDSPRQNESSYSNQVSVTLPVISARPATPKNVQVY